MEFIFSFYFFSLCFLVFFNNITMIPPHFRMSFSDFSTAITVRMVSNEELFG
jgi:hypothetical protein